MINPVRILVAKPGLDGHDRGAKVIAQGFRNAGMEVIYTGLRQTPEQIVQTAIQEDVQVIALSCLSGAHRYLFPKVMQLLKGEGVDDIIVLGGGVIPEEDIAELKDVGIREVFTSGTPIKAMLDFINENTGPAGGVL